MLLFRKLIDDFLISDEEELKLPRCNAYVRKLIYQTIASKYGDDLNLETRIIENGDRCLFATRSSPEKKVEFEKKKGEKELDDLKDAVGFSTVIQYISDSVSLRILHFCVLNH